MQTSAVWRLAPEHFYYHCNGRYKEIFIGLVSQQNMLTLHVIVIVLAQLKGQKGHACKGRPLHYKMEVLGRTAFCAWSLYSLFSTR